MFEYSAGGASTQSLEMFCHEEGTLSPIPSAKHRGNLYVTADGSPTECHAAIKAVRDRYFGDLDQPMGGNATALRQALAAANLIIGKRNATGVSVAAAVVSEWGYLSLLRAGDSMGFMYSSQDSEFLRLGDRQSAETALGRRSEGQFAEVEMVLRNKDIVILSTGSLLDCLSEEDIHSVAVLYAGEGAQTIARRLVEKATLGDNGGMSTALVLVCHTAREIVTADESAVGRQVTGRGSRAVAPSAPGYPALWVSQHPGSASAALHTDPRRLSPSPRSRFGWADVGKMPLVVGAAAVFVAALLLARPLLAGSSARLTSAPSTLASEIRTESAQPTSTGGSAEAEPTLESPEAVWARVDSLWKKGEGGDLAAWQEIVNQLEQLQSRTPTGQLGTRLGLAKTNLVYGQRMKDAANYWGTGGTKAADTLNWAKTVSTLEDLLAYPVVAPLSASQLNTAKRTLFSARVNYGKALEDAKRKDDARIQYERARELDPTRPEATDALKRLAK